MTNIAAKARSVNSGKTKKKSKSSSSDLKVVYISSPMKVMTCASNFRTTVQQLTGRDSDLVDRLMDEHANNNNNNNDNIIDVTNEIFMLESENGNIRREVEIPEVTVSNNSYHESPTSSNSMAFEDCGAVGATALMFSDVGGEGFDGGFSFEEIFGAAGYLLEYPVDENASEFC